jgi:carbon-monoxide dehydrogenase medium subunit
VGTSVTAADLAEATDALPGPWAILAEAAHLLGTPAVRNRATLGGNLCNASPAGDISVALLALSAEAVLADQDGFKSVTLADFFVGANETVLAPGTILVEVRIPAAPPGSGAAFVKLRRHQTSVDIATVNVACLLAVEDGVLRHARISLGAVAPKPVLAVLAAELLVGESPSPGLFLRAAEASAAEVHPIDDLRASATYRRKMVVVLVRRALETALGRC